MSVINKMLQDLEARESDTQTINADYQAPEKKPQKYRFIIFVGLALFVIGLSVFIPLESVKPNNETIVTHQSEPGVSTTHKTQVANISGSEDRKPFEKSAPKIMQVKSKQTVETVGSSENAMQKVLVQVDEPNEQTKTPLQDEFSRGEGVLTNSESAPQLQESEPVEPITIITQSVATEPEVFASFSMTGADEIKQTVSLKQQVSEQLAAGNNKQAALLLTQLIKEKPEDLQARKKLASIYFAQGNYVQAKFLLKEAIEQFPSRSDFRMMLARMLVIQNQTDSALLGLVDFEPQLSDQEFLAYRASLAQQLKQVEVARADYLSLTRINGTNAKWWLGLGIIEDQAGNSDKALAAYQQISQDNQLEAAVTEFIQQRIIILGESQ
jgi:MSHA biogenesis protein MshN